MHQIAHLVDNGVSGLLAASLVGVMGLLRAVSSTVWGGLSDRVGREVVYTIGTGFGLLGLVCLALVRAPAPLWLLYGYALAFGIGYGVHGAVEAAAAADLLDGP